MERTLVAVVGSANMDLVFDCDHIPETGETTLGSRFRMTPGGKGANQAVAIARLGGDVALVAAVGNDSNGAWLLSQLATDGIDARWVVRLGDAVTGVAGIFVGDDGSNSIVVVPGANARLQSSDVSRALADLAPVAVLAQLEIPLEAVSACQEAPHLIVNPAPATTLPEELLSKIHVITPNESETRALTGYLPSDHNSCTSAAQWFHSRGIVTVVLTLGEHGCYVSERGLEKHFEPPCVQVVDTTAAGDAFSGALAHFLARGREVWNAAPLANHVAALSATKFGAQESMPTLEELRRFAGNLL